MLSTHQNQDKNFMSRALELAAKGRGKVSPNPMVGAVVVKNGKIIAEGFHHAYGKDHAEVDALKKLSMKERRGTTIYVNLEPCAHFGKRPPCADYLIECGVKKVVVAMKDPHKVVNGKGLTKLRRAGIEVVVGVLNNEAKNLNEAFIKNVTTSLPFVVLKIAASLDGRIATETGNSKWITNELSRKRVHQMRSEADALITSSNTVVADDPNLGVYLFKGRSPLRVILDRHLKTSASAQVYRDTHVVVFALDSVSTKFKMAFAKRKIEVLYLSERQYSLKNILKILYKEKRIGQAMVEAGSMLSSTFLKEKLVDKICYFVAPLFIGKGLDAIGDLQVKKLTQAIHLQQVSYENFGDNTLVIGYPA